MRTLRCLLPFLLVAACSGGDHALAGSWSQELPGGAKGMSVEFDVKSDKVFVHTAPRPDGSHDHLDGTYAWVAASKSVTVKAKLGGDGKADTWTGTVNGEHLELSSPDGKLLFHHGEEEHDH